MTGRNMLLTKEHNVARIVIKQAIIGTHVLSYMEPLTGTKSLWTRENKMQDQSEDLQQKLDLRRVLQYDNKVDMLQELIRLMKSNM